MVKLYKVLLCVFLLHLGSAHSKVLDKIVAIFNNQVITLSMVERVENSLKARRSISPQIFNKNSFTHLEIIDLFINTQLIRTKLSVIGYNVNDEQVEDRVKALEKQLGIGRLELLDFLKNNGLTFNEYFELIRETIEFNIFHAKVITPLISITEQQIKNTFYKKASANKTLSFKYNLVDFSIDSSKLSNQEISDLPKVLIKYQASGILPEIYKSIETNVIGDIEEDGLTSNLVTLLKKTDEGSFSKPFDIGTFTHVFFVRKKDLVESSIYLKSKESINRELFEETSDKIAKTWFKTESNKHYIKLL